MRRLIVPTIVATLLLASSMTVLAQGRAVSPDWKVYSYTPSGNALGSQAADASDTGLAAFTFAATPDDALFATERPEGPHASIYGRTITATFTVTTAPGTTFSYYGEGTPSNPCGTPASVRLYFNTNGAFGFGTDNDWYSKYWWSNPVSQVLRDGELTLTATVLPAGWSNWNGQMGTARADGFAAAASDPDLIGFSFGGGCFFENGVGTPSGSATFTLTSFTID
jgi:hypothetical protein